MFPAAVAAEGGEPVAEASVTGSRLASDNASGPSPIVEVDSQELHHQGTARVEEPLNRLPQGISGLTLAANCPSVAPLTGTATADLRGIGAFRTLALVNGRRTAPGDPLTPSADLNTIPTAPVKRVEVRAGGASAIYGSDAVAVVVNLNPGPGFQRGPPICTTQTSASGRLTERLRRSHRPLGSRAAVALAISSPHQRKPT